MTPKTLPWPALACVVERNTRDVIERRFTMASEVASWFKALALFRETEAERLIDHEATPEDLNWHRALVATLIADGERLLVQWPPAAPPTADRISRADLEAALRGLYATQSMWHGELTTDQRNGIIRDVFGIDPDELRPTPAAAAAV